MRNDLEVVTKTGVKASLQVFQDIYNDLTGKVESSSRLFFDAHVVRLSDIENLHALIEQSLEQYHCSASNCSIAVRLCDGKSERFSSFEKFLRFGTNASRATGEVEIEYDFLIILPKTLEAKTYKLVVGLRSGIGIIEGFSVTEATETEKMMYYQLQSGSARLEIHYVDLAVARSLEAAVEGWYRDLKKVKQSWVVNFLRGNANWMPSIVKSVVVASVLWLSYYLTIASVNSVGSLFKVAVLTAGAATIAGFLTLPIALLSRTMLERSKPASAVLLSKRDDELYTSQNSGAIKSFLKIGLSVAGTVVIGLVTTYLAVRLGIG